MELQQLRYVLEVRDSGSFTRAAEALFVSQSALSQQIQKLERELDVTLFDRTTRTLAVTEAGREFCHYAQDVVSAVDRLEAHMKTRSAARRNRLNLLTFAQATIIHLPQAVTAFLQEQPHIILNYQSVMGEDLLSRMASEEWDLLVIRQTLLDNFSDPQKYCCELLFKEDACLMTAASHPLARRTSIALDELKEQPILFGTENSPQALTLRKILPESKNTTLKTQSYAVMAEMVHSGQAVAVGARSTARYYGFCAIPFSPARFFSTYVVYSAQRKPSPLMRDFIDYLKVYYLDWWNSPT